MRETNGADVEAGFRRGGLTLLLVIAVVSSAADVGAQACCSAAPQAPPGALSGQGIGSLFPGQGWLQTSLVSFDTGDQFGSSSSKESYAFGGRLDLTSFLVTGAVGLVSGLEVWAQAGVHSLEFGDDGGARTRTGVGDVRVWLRAGPRLVGVYESDLPVWLGLRAGVKAPGSDFPVDQTVIPLTEGQEDFELALELGRVLADGRLSVQAWSGYRWRGSNESVRLKPGNEWFGSASAAVAVGPIQARLSAQFLDGAPYQGFGLVLPSSARELFGLLPTLAAHLGPGVFEIGAQLPLSGRNLPAGSALSLGYTIGFGGPPPPSLEDILR